MKPILFNTEMVRAILEDRKTVTRRVVKPQPAHNADVVPSPRPWTAFETETDMWHIKPPYRPGDILYVRETWNCLPIPEPLRGTSWTYWYKADESNPEDKWRPSIHMPREAARIFLRVTDVRVERLQDMSRDDAVAEGCDPALKDIAPDLGYYRIWNEMEFIWDSTIKPADRDVYGWEANPYVWVIAFERCEKPEGG